ncbi:MAG: hypothetical protein ACI81I_000078 [Arcobacteraceae bacterium]|jgi:hypothetical protein
MAYINKEEVKNIREKLKKEFPLWKFSVTGGGSSSLNISILKSNLDFRNDYNSKYQNIEDGYCLDDKERETNRLKDLEDGYATINIYHLESSFNGNSCKQLKRLLEIAKSQDWLDETDSMTDYFYTAYYINFNLGKWRDDSKGGIVKHEIIKTEDKVQTTVSNEDFNELIDLGIIEPFIHTKTGDELDVLKLNKTLSKEDFKKFNDYLKSEKIGYYSRYAKGFILTKKEEEKVA